MLTINFKFQEKNDNLLFGVVLLVLQLCLATVRTIRNVMRPMSYERQEVVGVFPKLEHVTLVLDCIAIPILVCKLHFVYNFC